MKRGAVLAALLLVAASCAAPPPTPAPAGMAPACRPDGRPVVSERGIGGTGLSAERGIGGTGIIGVITGFASVCVAGLEVAVDAATQVTGDVAGISVAALRVGQVVAISAEGERVLHARSIVVRHEVSGPIEAVDPEAHTLVVAGQRVQAGPTIWGFDQVHPGDWVDVSGLPRPDASIRATRLDSRPPGTVTVHGWLQPSGDGMAHIGALRLRLGAEQAALVGRYVVASGRYVGSLLIADRVAPDLLLTDPPAWFGPASTRLLIETYTQQRAGQIQLPSGFSVPVLPGIAASAPAGTPSIMTVQRNADGVEVTTNLRAAPVVSIAPNTVLPAVITPPTRTPLVPASPSDNVVAPPAVHAPFRNHRP